MQARIVIVAYKPKPGKAESLRQLMRQHYATLKEQNLITDRASIIMAAKDGTIIEVFEWKSKKIIEQAHNNPAVLKMWEQYQEVCEYVPLSRVDEASTLFSEFSRFV